MFEGLHFANLKASYYFILGFCLVGLLYYSLLSRKRALSTFAELSSLKQLLFLEKRTLWRYLLLLGCFLLAVFSLMQPERFVSSSFLAEAEKEVIDEHWEDDKSDEKVTLKRKACDVYFLIDTSQSMEIDDTRTKVTRLEYAKEIIDEIIHHLDGQNVALYAFTSELTPLVPPTMDYIFTRLLSKNIQINEGDSSGTDLLEALEKMQRNHFSKSSDKQNVLILLTDGGDTYYESVAHDQKKRHLELILEKIKPTETQNVQCFTIGLGSEQGGEVPGVFFEGEPILSTLNSDLLKEMSKVTSGAYYFANAYSALEIGKSIVSSIKENQMYVDEEVHIDKKLMRTALENQPSTQKVIHYYQIPLALAILLLSLEILLPLLPLNKEIITDD